MNVSAPYYDSVILQLIFLVDTFLDKDKTVSWVGAAFLESKQASGNSIHLIEFLQGWRDLLPESWRPSVNLHAIKVFQAPPQSSDQLSDSHFFRVNTSSL